MSTTNSRNVSQFHSSTARDSVNGSVRGRTAALLELGAGFHPDLTGVENLPLNASLLGLSRGRTTEVFDSVIAFADIGDFIYEPIRTYSMGMTMRLAFAVAIHVDPDILILDEVLAVGDQGFQGKRQERIAASNRKVRRCSSSRIPGPWSGNSARSGSSAGMFGVTGRQAKCLQRTAA